MHLPTSQCADAEGHLFSPSDRLRRLSAKHAMRLSRQPTGHRDINFTTISHEDAMIHRVPLHGQVPCAPYGRATACGCRRSDTPKGARRSGAPHTILVSAQRRETNPLPRLRPRALPSQSSKGLPVVGLEGVAAELDAPVVMREAIGLLGVAGSDMLGQCPGDRMRGQMRH